MKIPTPEYVPRWQPIKLSSTWIAGFSAGEMSFIITIQNNTYKLGKRARVLVSLPQHERDLPILVAIQNHMGCGYIVKDSGNRRVWIFRCDNPEELENKILPFFDRFNLVTSNFLDFQDMWRFLYLFFSMCFLWLPVFYIYIYFIVNKIYIYIKNNKTYKTHIKNYKKR
jgi:hypothetical protein